MGQPPRGWVTVSDGLLSAPSRPATREAGKTSGPRVRQGHTVGPALGASGGPGFFQVSVSLVFGLLQLAGDSSARVEGYPAAGLEPSSRDVHTVRAQLRGWKFGASISTSKRSRLKPGRSVQD